MADTAAQAAQAQGSKAGCPEDTDCRATAVTWRSDLATAERWPLAPFSATAPENAVTGAEKSNQAAGHEVRRPRRQAL